MKIKVTIVQKPNPVNLQKALNLALKHLRSQLENSELQVKEQDLTWKNLSRQ